MSNLNRIALVVFLLPLPVCVGADWPQFRGPNSSGIAATGSPPVDFGPGTNELWKAPIPAGHSSPCVAGDRIFLTTVDKKEKKLGVVCVNRHDGSTLWSREIAPEQFEKGHPSFNPASSSPCTDGQRVVAYFGSYGLVCYDIKGDKLWELKLPMTKSFGGNATSPALIGDQVILYRGNYVDHYLLAVDKNTGAENWKVKQDEPFSGEMACTSCPIVAGEKLIVHTARSVQAFNLSTGEQLWIAKCATTATSTPIVAGDEVVVAAWNKLGEPALRPEFPSFDELIAKHDRNEDGEISKDEFPTLWIFHRPEGMEAPMNGATVRFQRSDSNKDGVINETEWKGMLRGLEKFRSGYNTHGILAIPIDSKGVIGPDQIRVLQTRSIPEVPSPLCDGKYIYYIKNGGILTCLELESGDRIYQKRTEGRGTHYASPLIADGKIFAIAGDGKISVIAAGPKMKILATNDMQENVYATPAIVDGTIYVRTHTKLFAFGKASTRD